MFVLLCSPSEKNRMRILVFIGILLFQLTVLSAQSEGIEERFMQANDSLQTEEVQAKQAGPHFGLQMGSGLSYSPVTGALPFAYVSPGLSYPLSSRLSVHGGMVFSTSFFPQTSSDFKVTGVSPYTSLSLYTAASYRLDERLTLYGAGMKRVINLNSSTPLIEFSSVSAFSFGASYKLGNNITIGAGVVISDGWNPYPFAPSGTGLNPIW